MTIQKNGFDSFDLSSADLGHTWEERGAAIHPSAFLPPRLLLIGASLERQTFLEHILQEEGYVLQIASSLEQALTRASARTFDFVLAHLPTNTPGQLFKAIKPLREHIHPIKLGVITSWGASAEEAEDEGLAFVLPRSILQEQLLAKIALCLHMPLSPQQERQALVIERFLDALTCKERQTLVSLCTDDVVAYSLPASPAPLAGAIRGKDALGIYAETLRSAYRALRLEVQHIYSRPKGLVVEYLRVTKSNRGWGLSNDAFLVHFTGDRIRQIGLRDEIN